MTHQAKILIVDDEPQVRSAMRLLLEQELRQARRQFLDLGPIQTHLAQHVFRVFAELGRRTPHFGGRLAEARAGRQRAKRAAVAATAAVQDWTQTPLAKGLAIGIGLGIFQRGGHLLSAFGVSCVPGAILGASIISGKRIIEGTSAQGPTGLLVMWGGLAFLVLLALWICGRLVRR